MQTSMFIQAVPTHFDLFDDQIIALSDVENAFASGLNRVLLVLPTGGGKTVVASEKIRRFVAGYKRVLFLAHRRELIFQCSDKLKAFGVDHGIIMAGEARSFMPDVQVASIDTLRSRLKNPKYAKPEFDLIIIDEAHHAVAKSYLDLVNAYPNAKVLGLTATPIRGDGRGLGELFQIIVEGATIEELTKIGRLVPVEYYAPSKPDLEGLKIKMGDYAENELAKRMDKVKLIGDIVENWSRICPDRVTLVFSTGVPHSIHIRDAFRDAGVNAEHIDGDTPKAERDKIINDVNAGSVQVLTNCMVFTEGTDIPIISCIINANPTKSLGKYMQTLGRGLRVSPGKLNCIMIDHGGVVHQHGFIDEPKEWSLDGNSKIQDRIAKLKEKQGEPSFQTCKECFAVFTKKDKCPVCGWMVPRKAKAVEFVEGKLGKIDRFGKTILIPPTLPKERVIAELLTIQQAKQYKIGWVKYNFMDMFGYWPKNINFTPAEPSTETLAWLDKKLNAFKNKKRRITG